MSDTEQTPRTHCAIEEALTVVGDRWSLLVIRDVMRGVNRFDSLQDSLNISRNILTQRLNHLEQTGILIKSPIRPGAKRMLYNPTPKCIALAPVLVSLMNWSRHWAEDDYGKRWSKVIDKRTSEEVKVEIVDSNQKPVPLSQLKIEF